MKKILIFFVLIGLVGCGFKVVQDNQFNEYYVAQINTTGDSKINFRIKIKILSSSVNDNKSPIIINLKTLKQKSIKEKNIKNEVTKYDIKIEVSVEIKRINSAKINNFQLTKTGSYSVVDRLASTKINENRLIKNLSIDIAEDIKKQLSLILK